MKQYMIIVQSDDCINPTNHLEEKVNHFLSNGWLLIGGPCISPETKKKSQYIYQAMLRDIDIKKQIEKPLSVEQRLKNEEPPKVFDVRSWLIYP